MRADAFSVQNPIHDETDVDGYGYGWRIHGEKMWHSGETMGFRNVIVRWPQKHFTVIVLTNRNDPEPYRLAMEVAGLYLPRSEEHTSELQSLMRISYAVFCLKT